MTTNLFPTGVRLVDTSDVIDLTQAQLGALAAGVTAGTLAANLITGGPFVVLNSAATTPGAQTTRSAVLMFADDPTAYPGQAYVLRICQSGAGTMTLTAGVGVTVTGTATIATTTFRDFLVQYTGNATVPTMTFTNIGTGTFT